MKKKTICGLLAIVWFCMSITQGNAVFAQDKGYWTLKYSEIVSDSKRYPLNEGGLYDYGPNFIDFTLFEYDKTSYQNGKTMVNGEELVDPSNTEAYREQLERITSSGEPIVFQIPGEKTEVKKTPIPLNFTWENPSEIIPIGKEHELVVGHMLKYNNILYSEAKRRFSTSPHVESDPSSKGFTPFNPGSVALGYLVSKYGGCDYLQLTQYFTVTILPELSRKYNYDYIVKAISNNSSPDEIDEDIYKYVESAEKEIAKYGSDYTWQCIADESLKDSPSVTMGKIIYSPISEGQFHSGKEAWNMSMLIGKNAVMVVKLCTWVRYAEYKSGGSWIDKPCKISQYYVYKRNDDGEINQATTYASSDEGEDEGTLLPPWVYIPALLIGAGTILVTTKNKKKKKGATGQKEDKKEEKKEKGKFEEENQKEKIAKKPSSYKMYIYKEFGDTLKIDDEPQFVGARIEEITADGTRIDRQDLTNQIEIEAGENIEVMATGNRGKYRCAKIRVPSIPKGSNSGCIYFTYSSPTGGLRNKVVFKIEAPEIVFFQENLTLPAVYKETSRLPFVIKGIPGEIIDHCEASFGDKDYTVEIEKSDDSDILWFAVIKEVNKKPMEPGKSTYHEINVKGFTKDGHVIETTFPVIRLQMGLYFECSGLVGCYVEPYDPVKHNRSLILNPDARFKITPAQTFGTFTLLTWDKEKHHVIRVLPDIDKATNAAFKITVVPNDDAENFVYSEAESRNTLSMSEEEFIGKLGIDAIIDQVEDDLSVRLRIFAHQFMDAPSRRHAKLTISMKYDGEEYSAEKEVLLTSMPLREGGMESLKTEQEIDEDIKDRLYYIKNSIKKMGAVNNLFPVIKTIDLMLDGYHHMFGFDAAQLQQVISTYNKFCRGEVIGANAEPESMEDIGFLAETMRAFANTGTQVEEWMATHGSWKTRMALGLITLGWSEAALTACKTQKMMIDVVEREKDPGGAWEAFRVGVIEVAKEYAFEKVTGKIMDEVGGLAKKTSPELFAKTQKNIGNVGGKVQEKLGFLGKDVKDVFKDIKGYAAEKFGSKTVAQVDDALSMLKKADKNLDDAISDFRRKATYTPEEELEEIAYNEALQQSMHTVKEYEEAYLEWAANRTQENLKRIEEYVLKIQGNKAAQRALSLYNGKWGNNLRARFYDIQQPINRTVQNKAAVYIAEKMRSKGYNVDVDDIYAFHATNSNVESLHNGTSITRDLDVTMKVRGKRISGGGEPVDFDVPQDIAEECYSRAYKETTGYSITKNDHSVVQTGSPEMIGCGESDLRKAFDRESMRETFTDPMGVADAFKHKVDEWLNRGDMAKVAGDNEYGHLWEEGIRQGSKTSEKCLIPMAVENGCLTKLPMKDVEFLKSLNRVQVVSSGPLAGLSPTDFNKFIQFRFGMDKTKVGDKLKEICLIIENSKKL